MSDGGAHGLVRLGIRVRREQAEIALANLLGLMPGGAEETEPDQDEVEYAIYALRAELPRLDDVRALAGDALIDVTLTDVPPGWERRWHQYLEPVEVAAGTRRLRVRPPWRDAGASDMLEIVIDPGASFGAGTHPTTQLCLELLLESEPADGPLCDWGSGSGVLAITAALLGYGPVSAVEVELDALETIRANAAANAVSVRTHWLNLGVTAAPWAPTVVANLTRELLLEIAAEALERPPERLILSGVLESRADEVAAAFTHHSLHETERRVRAGWAALVLERT